MILFLVTGISFIFFIKSLSLKPLPSWASDVRFLPLCILKELSYSISSAIKGTLCVNFIKFPMALLMELRAPNSSKHVKVQESEDLSVLDLPELALECILERLSPSGLCSMARVCSAFRDRCTSDYFWRRHMDQKWGRVIGPIAYRHWQCFIDPRRNLGSSEGPKTNGWIKLICGFLPFSMFGSKFDDRDNKKSVLPVDSIMSWYLALDTGRFWFPAQVFNRENGHVGFMLSCYDAELSYDSQTDTFKARYPPHGRRAMAIENFVQWERIRAPPIETCSHELHVSDCLSDLHPGDHIEIQWRRHKGFPYGWWYGRVGHLELCDGNQQYCHCHRSGTVVLEFNQYNSSSRWRRATINRKEHREEGNEGDGFYGGIRKLYDADEISRWKKLWPVDVLE
ncbi:F-box protein-like protein [Drosera capensis]